MKLHRLGLGCIAILVLAGAASAQEMAAATPSAPPSSAAPAPAPKPDAQVAKASPPAWSPFDAVNEALPKWLSFSGQLRFRVEGYTDGGFNPANEDAYLLTRLWLNLKVQPTSWMKLYFQSMDSHAPWKKSLPAGAPFRDTMDLRQGYVEFGDVEKPSFGLRFGRQELDFGEGRLLGISPWANTARSFDGFRSSYVGNGYRVDGFAATVVNINQDEFDWSRPGNNLYGVYTSFKKVVPRAVVEPYFLWRRQSGLRTELAQPGISNFGTYGVRWVGKAPANFDYNTDIVGQHGSLGVESINAWASHWVLGYTIPRIHFTPRLFAEYNYASGDKNPTDNKRGTFDMLYPSGHDKWGLTDQVGWQNMHHVRTGGEVKLNKKLSASMRYNAYWLADPHDALYNGGTGAVVARDPSGASGRYVGQGFDIVSNFNFNSRFSLSGGYGKVFAGTFLKNRTPGASYNYPYLMTVYSF